MEQKEIKKIPEKRSLFNNLVKYPGINLKIFFIFVFLLLFNLGHAQNQTIQIPKLQHEDIEVIAEAYNLWKTKGDEVWKGWSQINIPFIYKKERYEYWVNFPTAVNKGRFVERVNDMDVYGQAVSDTNGLAASMDIDNIPAVVLSSPQITGMTKEKWIITALHEMFHVFQGIHASYQKKVKGLGIGYGKDASWMLNYPFPYKDTSLKTISHMQGYLLFKIYSTNNFRDNMYDCILLKDILSLYKNYMVKRYGDENNYKYSVFQQSVEGVAKYTEIKMAEIAKTDYVPLSPDIHFTDVYTNQINVVRHCGKGTGGRLTFYYLGLGKCLILDKINPGWKGSYFGTAWLDELIDISLKQIMEKQRSLK